MAKRCGAQLRGKPGRFCRQPPLEGAKRCKLHGGLNQQARNRHMAGFQQGNEISMTHGLYTNSMTEAEKKIWHKIPVGSLDEEIKALRLKLQRALQLQADYNEGRIELDLGNGLETVEIRRTRGDENKTMVVRRQRDFLQDIYKFAGRIAHLEQVNFTLKGGETDSPATKASLIREALQQIEQLEDT